MDIKQIIREAQEYDLKWMDDPIESDKWIIIGFLKCGRRFNGEFHYSSEQRALKAIQKWEDATRRIAENNDSGDVWCSHDNAKFFWSEYLYALPMPVKE